MAKRQNQANPQPEPEEVEAAPEKAPETISVKMLAEAQGPGISLSRNLVYVLDSVFAGQLIKGGYAVEVKEKAADPKAENRETR